MAIICNMFVTTFLICCKFAISMSFVKVAPLQCLVMIESFYKLATQQYLLNILAAYAQYMIDHMDQVFSAITVKCMKFVRDELGCPGVGRIQPCCLGDFQPCCLGDSQPCPHPFSLWDSQCYCPGGTTWLGCPEQELFSLAAQKRSFQLGCPHPEAKLAKFRNTNIFCWWSVTAEFDASIEDECSFTDEQNLSH